MFILAQRNKMKITFISDTHTKHHQVTSQLPGGDLLIHAGDLMNSGYNKKEINHFCEWFESQDYKHKIFIAGNHDKMFEDHPLESNTIVNNYDVTYLLKQKWSLIPTGTDILITHGPPYGHLDTVVGQYNNLGCKMLSERIEVVKPKIHVFGHIHSGYGYKFENGTHYINASVLGEDYIFKNKPLTVEWDPDTNEIKFLN